MRPTFVRGARVLTSWQGRHLRRVVHIVECMTEYRGCASGVVVTAIAPDGQRLRLDAGWFVECPWK